MGHVTESQRYTIERLLMQGYSQSAIANILDKCKSVISREVRRNRDPRTKKYSSKKAHIFYIKRLKSKPNLQILTTEIAGYIIKKLKLFWSPEQISKTKHGFEFEMVSPQAIYDFKKRDKAAGGKLFKFLRRKRRYRRLNGQKDIAGQIKNRVNICERPEEANNRERFGDFEIDLILGSKNSGAILSINDRMTGWVKLRLVKTKQAKELTYEVIKALTPLKSRCKTITSDNGKEFSNHRNIARRLGVEYYFCDPYCSWQRGSNENLNGLVRQFFPKGSSFSGITTNKLKKVEKLINYRPRKRYNFKSPKEIFDLLK